MAAGVRVAVTAAAVGAAVADAAAAGGVLTSASSKTSLPLVRLDNGLELYRFRYKGSDRTLYVGVMAQDVSKIDPSAVSHDRDGYLLVDYDRIGLRFMTWKEWLALARKESDDENRSRILLGAALFAWSARLRQEQFNTPEAAVDALVGAARSGDAKAILAVLGPDGQAIISSGDPVADTQCQAEFRHVPTTPSTRSSWRATARRP